MIWLKERIMYSAMVNLMIVYTCSTLLTDEFTGNSI